MSKALASILRTTKITHTNSEKHLLEDFRGNLKLPYKIICSVLKYKIRYKASIIDVTNFLSRQCPKCFWIPLWPRPNLGEKWENSTSKRPTEQCHAHQGPRDECSEDGCSHPNHEGSPSDFVHAAYHLILQLFLPTQQLSGQKNRKPKPVQILGGPMSLSTQIHYASGKIKVKIKFSLFYFTHSRFYFKK